MVNPGPPAPYDPWREVPPSPGEPPRDEWPHAGSGPESPQWPQPAAWPKSPMPVSPLDSTPTNPSWPPPVQYLPGALPAPRRRSRWRGVVSVVGAVLVLALGGVIAYQTSSLVRGLLGSGPAAAGSSPGGDTTDGIRSTADLAVGMCLTAGPSAEDGLISGELPVVDCARTHASEVVGTFTMPKGKYPGASGFRAVAIDKCFHQVQDYVGTMTPELAKLQVSYLAPTTVQWSLGIRVVACIAADPDGKRKGSIKG